MLRISQGSHYEGEDWWKWWVWLDGNEAELDQVRSVTYVLHPTFQKPVRIVDTRQNKFQLSSAGWGAFVIRAKVLYKDGHTEVMEHQLELLYPSGEPTSA